MLNSYLPLRLWRDRGLLWVARLLEPGHVVGLEVVRKVDDAAYTAVDPEKKATCHPQKHILQQPSTWTIFSELTAFINGTISDMINKFDNVKSIAAMMYGLR